MKIAVYAGSFDPVTNGHLWMIEQGVKLFDELVVALGENPDKRYTFSSMSVCKCCATVHSTCHIVAESFENQFLVNYAQSIGANYILRCAYRQRL